MERKVETELDVAAECDKDTRGGKASYERTLVTIGCEHGGICSLVVANDSNIAKSGGGSGGMSGT